MRQAVAATLALLLALSGCKQSEPVAASPALWEVTGRKGEQGWLFGTIHALPERVEWRSAKIQSALASSDRLVLEIKNADDPEAIGAIFKDLAHTPGQPPVEQRIAAAARPRLAALMVKAGLSRRRFDDVETWAVAITLAQAAASKADSRYGIDRAIMLAAAGNPTSELEGAEMQLRIFDSLPEADQRDLLAGVVGEASDDAMQDRLGTAWRTGDMDEIEAQTRKGLLADPELREALLVNRNADWSSKVSAMLASGEKPFVAVGAAHMAGPDGLPALLAAQGYTVSRIQ